jgi:hypothetical protein
MAYMVVSRYRRPNTSVKWYSDAGINEEINMQVLELAFTEFHGRKIRTISEIDDLTLEVEYIWEDISIYEDWSTRPIYVQQQQLINDYNLSVGITTDPKEKMII